MVAVYLSEVPQPSWDYRPKFPRLASGGSCETKSFAEPLNSECFKGKRDARPEIKTFVQTGITNARAEGTSGGSNRSNVSDADSEIETIQHAGYDSTAPANSGPRPRLHADCPVKVEEPLNRGSIFATRARCPDRRDTGVVAGHDR